MIKCCLVVTRKNDEGADCPEILEWFDAKSHDDAMVVALRMLVAASKIGEDYLDDAIFRSCFYEYSPDYVWENRRHCFFPERQQ